MLHHVCLIWSLKFSVIFTESDAYLSKHGTHSIRPKFPKSPVQNQMEQKISGNSFRKFRSTSRGCPFYWKFGNSGNFPVHFYINKSAPVPLVVPESYKMAASQYYTGYKAICHSSSLLLIAIFLKNLRIRWKIVHWSFRISRWHSGSVLHNLPQEKFASLLSHEHNSWVGQVNISEEFA